MWGKIFLGFLYRKWSENLSFFSFSSREFSNLWKLFFSQESLIVFESVETAIVRFLSSVLNGIFTRFNRNETREKVFAFWKLIICSPEITCRTFDSLKKFEEWRRRESWKLFKWARAATTAEKQRFSVAKVQMKLICSWKVFGIFINLQYSLRKVCETSLSVNCLNIYRRFRHRWNLFSNKKLWKYFEGKRLWKWKEISVRLLWCWSWLFVCSASFHSECE